ncbi:MAG: flagellar hook-length control protein FliK [Pseudomonadota bacterium]
MRANPILPQADILQAAASAKSASSDVSGPSFNQFLNKEIASPKSASGSNGSQNNVNNNNNNNNNNVSNAGNNDNSSASQVDSKVADKPAQADAGGKTDKPKDAKDKDDDTDANTAAATSDSQAAGTQLIALVENLGKLATDKTPAADKSDDKKLDLAAIAGADKAALLGKSKPLADTKAGTDAAVDGKALTDKNPDLKADASLAGKKPVDAQLTDQSETKDDADSSKAKDVAALTKAADSRDAVKDALQQVRSPADAAAGADQKLEAAQELASAKALMQDNAAGVAPVQQTFAQQLAATATQGSTAAADHLAPRVGAAGWDQAVGQKVVWMVAGGKQTAELTLNPPDLGPMQVVLSVNNDKATATFVTAQPEVREALESAMPKLRQMMSDAGVQLAGFSFNTQSSNPGNQFSGNTPSGSNRFSHGLADADSTLASPAVTSSTLSRSGKLGMVDTFA